MRHQTPMALPTAFLDELRARLPVSQVAGRYTALKRRGREYVGLSPFNKERSPSFTVNDEKGFYHCFSSGEHGDIFTLTMKLENVGFRDAVERLAAEAGMAVPAESPQAREQADEGKRRLALIEAVAKFYQRQLHAPAGRQALAYLEGRGLDTAAIEKFRLGYAPRAGDHLAPVLAETGAKPADLVACGLAKDPEDGRAPYAFFRDRVLFPVADARGRVVSFGGRLLSGDGPKYINGPDTDLFHKGRLLYGLDRARAASARGHRVIIAEGYMDVIALVRAGFEAAVAPLGTAVTEAQIEAAWRLDPTPVLCLDGDNAGRRAAFRAVERVLPILAPDRTLKVAYLPEGEDPDTLIAKAGAPAMTEVLDRQQGLLDLVWEKEAALHDLTAPEGRAGFRRALFAAADTIPDRDIRQGYRDAFADRFAESFGRRGAGGAASGGGAGRAAGGAGGGGYGGYGGGGRSGGTRWRDRGGAAPPGLGPRPTPVVRGADDTHLRLILLATLVKFPITAEPLAETLAAMEPPPPDLADLQEAVLTAMADPAVHDALVDKMNPDPAPAARLRGLLEAGRARGKLARLAAPDILTLSPHLKPDGSPHAALKTAEALWHGWNVRQLAAERARLSVRIKEDLTPESLDRLRELQRYEAAARAAEADALQQLNALPGPYG